MFLAHDAGTVAGPGEASSPVKMGRADANGCFDFLPDRDLLDRLGRANRAAQGAGVLAVALRHQQCGGPEACHAGFSKGGVDGVGGADFHTETATLATLEKIIFGNGTGWSNEIGIGYRMDVAVQTPQKR